MIDLKVFRDDNGTPANPNDDFIPVYVSGDANGNGVLDPGETWIFTSKNVPGAQSTVPAGTIANTVTVQARCVTTGVPGCVSGTTVADTAMNRVTSNGTPNGPSIHIQKTVSGAVLAVGSTVTWTYLVSNPGKVQLTITQLVDDNATPDDATDDFTPAYVSGDVNGNGKLDPGEIWTFTATGPVLLGSHTNHVVVQASPATGSPVADDATATYLGTTGIRIKKAVNALDPLHPTADEEADVSPGRSFSVGTPLVYTYRVFGDSALPITISSLHDVQGNFDPVYVSGDTNLNGKLDFGEVWLYTSAGVKQLTAVAGTSSDTATVTGTNGAPLSASDVAWVTGTPTRLILHKAINAPDPAHPTYFDDADTHPASTCRSARPSPSPSQSPSRAARRSRASSSPMRRR